MTQFPSRHSCRYCKETIISALRPRFYRPTYLGSVNSAIEAANSGCILYEWLLDFLILSYTPVLCPRQGGKVVEPPELVGREEFYLDVTSLPYNMTDVHSVRFLIGTENYSWPCATFDVLTEAGQCCNNGV
jgi:hypothetical protein